jgi:hypothetical protein
VIPRPDLEAQKGAGFQWRGPALGSVDRIEEGFEVAVHRLMGVATFAEAVAVLAEVRLENRVQHLGHGLLDHKVTESTHSV